MTKKQKELIRGIIKTIVVCAIGAIGMYFTGDWPERRWLIFFLLLSLPYYFVYKIYWKTDQDVDE